MAKPLDRPKPPPKPVRAASAKKTPQTVAPLETKNATAAKTEGTVPKAGTTASSSPVRTNVASNPRPLSRGQPSYPKRARDMNIEGEVVAKYDVTKEGNVDNIRIITSTPKNLFDRDVKQSMRRWRYESKPAKDLTVTILFKLKGGTEIR